MQGVCDDYYSNPDSSKPSVTLHKTKRPCRCRYFQQLHAPSTNSNVLPGRCPTVGWCSAGEALSSAGYSSSGRQTVSIPPRNAACADGLSLNRARHTHFNIKRAVSYSSWYLLTEHSKFHLNKSTVTGEPFKYGIHNMTILMRLSLDDTQSCWALDSDWLEGLTYRGSYLSVFLICYMFL